MGAALLQTSSHLGGMAPPAGGLSSARRDLAPDLGRGPYHFPMRVIVNLVFPDASSGTTVTLIRPFDPAT